MDKIKVIFETVIKDGKYNLADMLSKIERYHISGDLSDSDKEELVEKARLNADAKNGVDLFAMFVELETRVKALEEGKTNEGNTEAYPEWKEHKRYYRGDKCSENGKNYICIALEGFACIWSPSQYPAYWEEV